MCSWRCPPSRAVKPFPIFEIQPAKGDDLMRVRLLLSCALLLLAVGCNSKAKFVPVSGKVTLDGKPLANATVSFQPEPKGDNVIAGVGSTGKTNENGEFVLMAATGEIGAIIGKHRVVIT